MIFSILFLFLYKVVGSESGSSSFKIQGVSLGSLFVLEPFITPSLFYSFLGNKNKVISDTYSFCDVLGPIEANYRLRNHWTNWVNESTIKYLAGTGINTIRIPVGDYMYIPYGPYNKSVDGIYCFSGSLQYLDLVLSYCEKYNLHGILDVHAWKDSQNGFDNSGQAKNMEVYKVNDTLYFKHWPIRSANWIGEFELHGKYYKSINYENLNYSLRVLQIIFEKYKDYKMVWGLSPINEPWEYTPANILKDFYKKVYDKFVIMWSGGKKVLILHDSFRPYLWESCDFLDYGVVKNVYLDTHYYIAWNDPVVFESLIQSIRDIHLPKSCLPFIVGEFSLATDNCMMWLNGFMDNLPNYPFQQCLYEKCPKYYDGNNSYLIQNSKDGPFGIGVSYPTVDGFCPMSTPISLNKIISNKIYSEDIYARQLFQEFIKVFNEQTEGWIFWNFRTESNFYSWNFMTSYEVGYIQLNIQMLSSIFKKVRGNESYSLWILSGFSIILLGALYYLKYLKIKNNSYNYIDITKLPIKYGSMHKIYVQENNIRI
jgi:glucan 1,3-beta-glucosidase